MIQRPLSKLREKTHLDETLRTALVQLGVRKQNPNQTHHLFDEIPSRTLDDCNHLLIEYSRNNLNREAINLFTEIPRLSKSIDECTLSCTLRACRLLSEELLGRQLHSLSIRLGFDAAVSVGTSLVDLYMKCSLLDARRVFDLMPERNVFTWTSLLAGYTRNGLPEFVYKLFLQMQVEGIKPNLFTLASVLSSSAAQRTVNIGKRVHCLLIKLGFESTTSVCNSLINMYSKCSLIQEAKVIFEQMENYRNVITWNTTVAGLVQNGLNSEALQLFNSMRTEGHKLTQSSFVTAVKLCDNLQELSFAQQLHCCVLKEGNDQDSNIATALLVVYSKCSQMSDAFELFSVVSEDHSVVSWTAIITGCIQNGESKRAANLFVEMTRDGVEPNDFTYSSILTADPAPFSPFEIHCQAIKRNYLNVPSVGTALLTSYSKLGETYEAMSIFKRLNEKDIITWSALLATYAQSGESETAIELFKQMASEGFLPNEFTFSSAINVCASPTVASDQGNQFHAMAIKSQHQDALCVSSALVTMYSKKGSIESAQKVFERQLERDLVSFNSMLAGYAQHGYGKKALKIFQEMLERRFKLDGITFIGVLVACTHAGLVEEGKKYFDSMVKDHEISPTMEHYSCMVDLFSRAGKLNEALKLINAMPFTAGSTVWRTLLGACRVQRNVDLGELAATMIIEMEPHDSAAYVLLSNIYASAGKWEKKNSIRKLMDERKVKKEAGISWIQVKNKVHSFLASDTSHPLAYRINEKLEEMMVRVKKKGYRPNTEFVLRDMEEELKEAALAQHSERLAIAYGLIVTPPRTLLQIVKNLRVCGDCHTVIKMISEIEERRIVVRDSSRFHHFEGGSCSCGDYW